MYDQHDACGCLTVTFGGTGPDLWVDGDKVAAVDFYYGFPLHTISGDACKGSIEFICPTNLDHTTVVGVRIKDRRLLVAVHTELTITPPLSDGR